MRLFFLAANKSLMVRRTIEILALIAFVMITSLLILNYATPASPAEPFPDKEALTEARHYLKLDDETVQCQICPRKCVIEEGQRGTCRNRKNIEGKLYSLVYARPCALNIDPVEKLPLFHVCPGGMRLNLATASCNLKCRNCQNWYLSQRAPEEVESQSLSPEQVVGLALGSDLKLISFTYTEPTVGYEYMYDIAKLAEERGIMTLLNTNGFINPKPLRELLQYVDAVNIDIKGFSEEFYATNCSGELEPVLRSAMIVKEELKHLEIVNLIIPTLNDDISQIREMCLWIKENLGEDVPLHFTRFFPAYKLTKLPPTPIDTLEKARETAIGVGLKYVYIGNVPGHKADNTYCPGCGEKLIGRLGLTLTENNVKGGKCIFCGLKIPGIWNQK